VNPFQAKKVAQALARHNDMRLTLGIYTHTELADQTTAIDALSEVPAVVAIARYGASG